MSKLDNGLKNISYELENYKNTINVNYKNIKIKKIQNLFVNIFSKQNFHLILKEVFDNIKELCDSFYILLSSIKSELNLKVRDYQRLQISFEDRITRKFNNSNIINVFENLKQEIVKESINANNYDNCQTFYIYILCLFDNR